MSSEDFALAPADLTIEVYTTPGRPFASAATPEGPGDDPTWSPSSATLIYGDHDAVLVDTLITYDQVDALADWIETKGRPLSRIYITHGHGDHWLGLARLIQRFPGAIGLATAEVLAQAADPAMAGYWEALFPGEIPGAGEKVLPQLLAAGTLDLEGNELRVIRIGQADTAQSTVLHVPSLAAAVTGDLAYNQVHMMTAETGEPEREQWITNLDAVAAWTPPSWSPATRKSRTTTTRRSLRNPSGICGTSPGSLPRRPPRPASSPGWPISIPAGRTSAHYGTPRERPSPGRTASGLSPDGGGAAAGLQRRSIQTGYAQLLDAAYQQPGGHRL